jgi:uncharacterized protein YlxW (UPF0749 family)
MSLPAQLYAVPQVARPARHIAVVDRKKTAVADHERDVRTKRKIEQADRVLNQLADRSKMLAAQIKALQRIKNAADARYEKIEDRIVREMTAARLEKAPGLRVTFSTRLAPASLIVDNENLIPAEYFNEKIVSTVDKVAIKAAIERGVEFKEGALHLAQKVSLIRK